VERGTGTLAKVPGVNIAGKTGTAQNPHGKDHAWFIAFAPVEHPKIAMAVLVENAGFGGAISAPIARELIRYYVKGEKLPVASSQKGTKPSETTVQQPDSTKKITPVAQPEKAATTPEPVAEEKIKNDTGKTAE
jgi:penicillin-binding protein 2